MPHIVIKAIEGQPPEKMKEVAAKLVTAVADTLGAPTGVVSVSLEEFPRADWVGVYDEYIRDKDNVLVKPGYSNPVTFE
jgi:phenylpyruvate tautomerase PptA (4-oxalocrotonate tautomerase family)